jgi:hypothetical protein
VNPNQQEDAAEEDQKELGEEPPTAKKEEAIYAERFEENATEEHGLSNRPLSTTFIPPLTPIAR